jgi:hypothetical protein
MKVAIYGAGVWGPGFADWPALQTLLGTADKPTAAAEPAVGTGSPKSERIPANERRRAPLPVKLAIEVASQACAASGFEAAQLLCVFGSGLGDTDITDNMCRALMTPEQLISPTRFHNSVHNAAAGYWSIVSGCRAASSSVSGFEYTFPVTLLESVIQCISEQQPVLFAVYDTPAPAPLDYPLYNRYSFAAALVLAPPADILKQPRAGRFDLELQINSGTVTWPPLKTAHLEELYRSNPAARCLALLENLLSFDHHQQPAELTLPLTGHTALTLHITGTELDHPCRKQRT